MRLTWTPEMNAFLKAFVPGHDTEEIFDAFEKEFGIRLSKAQLSSRKNKLGVKSGTNGGQWKKGRVSKNKGKTWAEMMPPESQEKCRKTLFGPGREPYNKMKVGEERLDSQGYLNYKTPEGKWRRKHIKVWEEANGRKVPKGHRVVFADKDKANLDPENLVLVSHEDWVRLITDGLPFSDRETLESCLAVTALKAAIREYERAPRECRRCGATFVPEFKKQRTCRACLDGRKKER